MRKKELKEKLLTELEAKGYKCKFRGNTIYSDWSACPSRICTLSYLGRQNVYRVGIVTSWSVTTGTKGDICFSDDISGFARTIIHMAGFY